MRKVACRSNTNACTHSFVRAGKIGPLAWQTYQQVGARMTAFGAGLRALGAAQKSRVGLYSLNRPEWVIAEQACHAYNICPVPLYGAQCMLAPISRAERSSARRRHAGSRCGAASDRAGWRRHCCRWSGQGENGALAAIVCRSLTALRAQLVQIAQSGACPDFKGDCARICFAYLTFVPSHCSGCDYAGAAVREEDGAAAVEQRADCHDLRASRETRARCFAV